MRRGRHAWPLAAALMASVAVPAAAQQAPPADRRLVMPPTAPDWGVGRTPPGETSSQPDGTPLIDCGRDLPCRVRLRGILGKNGAVAVEGTAFTW